ncbi:hypothetical protein JCM16303_003386 [Sporobolomyces ruberrimus]
MPRLVRRLCALVLLLVVAVGAQQSSPSPTVPNSSTAVSRIATSVRPTSTLNSNTTRILGGLGSVASVLQTALPSTTTSPLAASSTVSSSASATSGPPKLDTRIDATFGILGGLLIVSGLAIGSVGTLHRRPAIFVAGAYSGTLIVGLLIVHFALVDRVNPPKSITRGLFLLASLVAGLVGGGFCYLFHKAGQLVLSALAGFVLGSTLLCVRSDSLIRPVGLRYILSLGLAASFFVLASVPRLSLPVLLVSTSLLGSVAVVVGVDCFTTAGLKEFFVYSFGFTTLFRKLQGHYTLDSAITIELGVLLALSICMMAFQHRFYVLMGRKQQSERQTEREQTVRTTKMDERARKHTVASMGDWEEKYGNGGPRRVVSESAVGSEERQGKRKNWFGFGTSRKMSRAEGSSSSSTDKSGSKMSLAGTTHATSTDFLPRLEVEFGEPQRNSMGSGRPVLSPLQAAAAPVQKEGWDDYLSTRQVAMSSLKSESAPARSRSSLGIESLPARSRSSLALVSPPSSLPQSSPRFRDEGDDDDDTPLALSPRRAASAFPGSTRSHSSPDIDTARPATMYELPSTLHSAELAVMPRSPSRALSLAQRIPSVLLESPSRPSLPRSDSQPGTLDKAGRRATLLDLNEPSKFNPYNERERPRTVSEDRVVVGDRRKSMNSLASPKKVREAPKIMDFEDLDAKHRKRLSLLQTTAEENVAAENAKAEFHKKQQDEAVSQRRKEQHERRRSHSSNSILASPRSGTDEFGQLGGGRPKSIASLSGLLSLKRNSSSGDLLTEDSQDARRNSRSSPPRNEPERRQSAQSFSSNSKRLSQTSLASPPRNIRRHSLTTLLETSFDDANSEIAEAVRLSLNPRSNSGGLEKVTEWRRSGTLASLRAPTIQAPVVAVTPPPVEPATPTKKGSKKNSWLDY